ncbi:hypothetical protein RHSIM_Rhsim12G0087700 [Rhododendron simsii]|uniref:Uncharacterized protein n=1 Tax=Rhododendron simsii TaxID=118357 RepID=A0A834GA76_RHOSS|nr:hypothetical protein RHSIM_Rhsim12G0087700 [Rhododendron simsii]
MKTGKKQGDYQLGNSHIKPGGNGKSLSGMSVALNGENRLKDVANDKGASLASISTGKCGMICAELEDHTEVQALVVMGDSSKKTANVGAKTPGAGKRGRNPRVLDLGHVVCESLSYVVGSLCSFNSASFRCGQGDVVDLATAGSKVADPATVAPANKVWVMKTGKKQGDYQLGNSHIKPGGNGKSLSGMSVALNGENRLKDVANDKGASLASISTGKCGMICAELEDHTEVQALVVMGDSSKKTANVGAKTPGAGKRGRNPRVLDLGHVVCESLSYVVGSLCSFNSASFRKILAFLSFHMEYVAAAMEIVYVILE